MSVLSVRDLEVNSKPHESWMVKVQLAGEAQGLMDAAAYEALLAK